MLSSTDFGLRQAGGYLGSVYLLTIRRRQSSPLIRPAAISMSSTTDSRSGVEPSITLSTMTSTTTRRVLDVKSLSFSNAARSKASGPGLMPLS